MKNTIFLILITLSLYSFSQTIENDLKYHPGFDKNLAPFFHGVASGDASENSVIIWTRVTPKKITNSINVKWLIASDSLFKNIIDSGNYTTTPNKDYTVKIDVKNLTAFNTYYYKFISLSKESEIGKTKTLASKSDNMKKFRPVFFTGSNYNAGYFNAYRSICNRNDIDAVFHLGDYFYEYGNNVYGKNNLRSLVPKTEVFTLEQYRQRFSHYRLDKDLRDAHRQFCWYMIWDDHESANNSWKDGAQNHQKKEGKWAIRKTASKTAYFEWMPIREKNDSSIYKTYNVGNLARFILLDTRLEGRSYQKDSPTDTSKTLLGKKQLNWLFQEIEKAQKDSVEWIFITQQVMFAPMMLGKKVLNNDQWDGYQFERQKIINFIVKNNKNNTVIISGDIHTSWANEVYSNPKNKKKGIIIPEFITPSITSPSFNNPKAFLGEIFLRTIMPHIKYVDLDKKGYMVLNINDKKVKAEWYYLKTIKTQNPTIQKEKIIYIEKKSDLKIKKR